MTFREPSESAIRLLGWITLLGALAFVWWLLSFAAAGTGAELPHPVLATSPHLDQVGGRDPATDAWRCVNAVLAAVVLIWLWIRWFDVECPRDPFSKSGELILFMASLVGNVHAVIQGLPGTIAMPFVTLACLGQLLGLVRTRHTRWRVHKPTP